MADQSNCKLAALDALPEQDATALAEFIRASGGDPTRLLGDDATASVEEFQTLGEVGICDVLVGLRALGLPKAHVQEVADSLGCTREVVTEYARRVGVDLSGGIDRWWLAVSVGDSGSVGTAAGADPIGALAKLAELHGARSSLLPLSRLMRRAGRAGPDPTYDRTAIDANPVWRLAFVMSEIHNDEAPTGWGRYVFLAKELLRLYTIRDRAEPIEG